MIGQKGIPVIYGGVERHVEQLSLRLAQLGHQVTVYTRPYYTNSKLTHYKGIHLKSMPTWHRKNIDTILHTFLCTIDALRQNYDIIHYHGVGPSLLSFIPYLLKPKAKIITTFHAMDRLQKKWGVVAKIMLHLGEWTATHMSDCTITVSQQLLEYNHQKYPLRPIVYIPNGVSEQQPLKPEETDRILKNFHLKKNDYILTVGRLIPDKGVHYLITAFNKLATDVKLVIVGESHFHSNYVQKLKKMIQDKDKVIFTGFQTGKILQSLYENCRLYVHPSRQEGLPLTILEAMSYKKAVLASDIPQNMEIIKGIGASFKNQNIDDLRRNLQQLLPAKEKLQILGERGVERVRERYSWDDIVRQIDRLYISISTQSRPKVAEQKKLHT